jgi:hypothetical protein
VKKCQVISAAARALLCAALVALSGPVAALAQRAPQPPPQPQRPTDSRRGTLRVELPPPVAETPVPFEGGRGSGSLQTLSFVTPDVNFERNLVKGAPFVADALTEHVQVLADGNRFVRRSPARLFRDGAGRTRREHVLTRGPARASDGEEPRIIVINDPVGQVEYLVDTAAGTVRKRPMPPGLIEARQRAMGGESSFGVLMPAGAARRRMAEGDSAPAPPAPKREKLEAQLIEGVMAEGTRTTLTVPAGEMDNEQPMEITHEQWYSPELQMVVLLKHKDPRFGETVFRLTNITRGEPSADLFEMPQGYRVVDGREPLGRPPLRRLPHDQ